MLGWHHANHGKPLPERFESELGLRAERILRLVEVGAALLCGDVAEADRILDAIPEISPLVQGSSVPAPPEENPSPTASAFSSGAATPGGLLGVDAGNVAEPQRVPGRASATCTLDREGVSHERRLAEWREAKRKQRSDPAYRATESARARERRIAKGWRPLTAEEKAARAAARKAARPVPTAEEVAARKQREREVAREKQRRRRASLPIELVRERNRRDQAAKRARDRAAREAIAA